MAASDVASSAPAPAVVEPAKAKKPRQYKRLTKTEMANIAKENDFSMSAVAKALLASPDLVTDRIMAETSLQHAIDLVRSHDPKRKTVKERDVSFVLQCQGVSKESISAVMEAAVAGKAAAAE